MAAHSEETTRIIEKAILKSTLGKLFSPLAIFTRGDTFVVKHIKSTAKIGEIATIVSQPEISVKNVLAELLNPRRISHIFELTAEIALEKIAEEEIPPIECLQLFTQFLKSFIVDYPYLSIEQSKMVKIELLTISGQKTGTSIKLPAEFAQIYENLSKFEQSIEKKKIAVEEKSQQEDTAYIDLYIELKTEFDRIDHLPTVSESYQRTALTRQIVFIHKKIDLLKEKMLSPPENEEEKETLTPRENEDAIDKEKLLAQLIAALMAEPYNLSPAAATERAKKVFEESEQENAVPVEVVSSSSGIAAPPPPPLPPKERLRNNMERTLKSALGSNTDPENVKHLMDKLMPRNINKTAIVSAKGKLAKSTAKPLPRATKYTMLDKDLPEEVILHVLPTRPSEEQLAGLPNGYILTDHEKPVRARLYHLHQGQLVECHSGKLDALCSYVTESLKEKETPLNLDRQQHRKFIIETCGGHNYKKAESATPIPVAESSSSEAQSATPALGSSLPDSQGPSSTLTSAPENSFTRRASSLSFSQGARPSKYNLEGYRITLLKESEALPEDDALAEKTLHFTWNAEKKELAVKFKQADGTPFYFQRPITLLKNITLVSEAFGKSAEIALTEETQKFLQGFAENPHIGQRNSVAFRRPSQAQAPEQSGRRSVSPDKVVESAGDNPKEQDTAEKKERLTPSPTAVFMPPPVSEEKKGSTSPENTPASRLA